MSCPIRGKTFYWAKQKNREITITQYFGENKNALFYGPLGHGGIDFGVRHIRAPKFDGGTAKSKAYAPVICPYNGTVISDRDTQSDTKGRYIEIRTDVVKIDGKMCKAKIVLFHMAYIKKRITTGKRVRRGELLGFTGNTGEWTTGPHEHFGLKVYWQREYGSFNDIGEYINPMRFFTSCRSTMSGRINGVTKYWYKGKEITKKQRNLILKT